MQENYLHIVFIVGHMTIFILYQNQSRGTLSSGFYQLDSRCRLQDIGEWLLLVTQIKEMDDLL